MFTVYINSIGTDATVEYDTYATEAQARAAVADLKFDADFDALRDATLDEVDAAMAAMDINGEFIAVFIGHVAGADGDDSIAIVRDI